LVSNGVRGMLGVGFGITPDAPLYPALAERFLHLYASASASKPAFRRAWTNFSRTSTMRDHLGRRHQQGRALRPPPDRRPRPHCPLCLYCRRRHRGTPQALSRPPSPRLYLAPVCSLPKAVSMWVTTSATSRPARLPACAPSPRRTATLGARPPSRPGTPTPSLHTHSTCSPCSGKTLRACYHLHVSG
jgi:hypothetical protein